MWLVDLRYIFSPPSHELAISHATFMSGENPHYIANVVDENGKPATGPLLSGN